MLKVFLSRTHLPFRCQIPKCYHTVICIIHGFLVQNNVISHAVEYYAMTGFIAGSPREVLKTSYKAELISDDTWIEMLKGGRLKPFYHISIPVDQKLCKVPLDIRGVTEIRLGTV